MVLVTAKLICIDEAKQVSSNCLLELAQRLKDASDGVHDIILKVDKDDIHNLAALNSIKDSLEGLSKYIRGFSAEQVDAKDLVIRAKTIYTLFEQIDGDLRLKTSTLLAETNMVLAYASARWLADAASIIEDPKRALSINTVEDWSFLGEFERIAAEFQTRIPLFLGYRVRAEGRHTEIIISLKDGPRDKDMTGVSPLEQLKKEVEKFLAWELRKTGWTMNCDVYAIGGSPPWAIVCEIKVADR
jgi:hypothetical protein